ncbi:BQ5605_C008g04925 [Microbotryum silenes-dioicae]|uniref:BQ5605_C008g04925 protein n=1 Tax=Microbotryum silenes-dioicae TaxID=796604 RepID=A0A2X0MYN0_9BASI|nr:BQ5605_C008g04925 [Microbotryum silenes-dioicae]
MASTSTSGQLPHHHQNGGSSSHHLDAEPLSNRTLLVPSRLDNDDITINLDDLFSSPDDSETQIVVDLFKDERAPVVFWVRLVQEAWRIKRYTLALEMLEQGIAHLDTKGKCTLLCLKANYLVALARKAPKTVLSQPRGGPPLTHSTDPNHPESKLRDPHAPPNTKDALWQAAEVCIGRAEGTHVNDKTITDLKAVLMLARGRLDEASRLFESILATEPTHLYALMARARILFARRSFRLALKAYQQVLTLAPNFLPDPRIGIGLCCWLMGDRKKAKAAWNRSIVVHPDSSSNSATLLLGLAHLNTSKDPTLAGGEEARTEEYSRGIELIQAAFKKDNTSAAALGALANFFLLSGRPGSIKLAERMIQFADARILASEGYLHLARSLQSTGDRSAALSVYQQSSEMFPDQLLALLSEAQFLIESNSWPAAVNLYENVLRRNPRCAEALCALASIHAHLAFSDSSVVDSQAERKKAKDAYDQVLRLFASGKETLEGVHDHVVNKYIAKSERVRELARDEQMFVEIAKVWDDEMQGGERCLRAYREAQRILDEKNENEEDAELAETKREERALLATRLANNIGVLEYHRQDPIAAQESIEAALVKIGERIASSGGKISEQGDAALSVCTYNRGVILEALGDDELAINECYNQLLCQHPEYIEAKARLALIALRGVTGPQRQNNFELANQYLKEMLTTNSASLEVRALQSYYLYTAGLYRNLKDFARATLELDAKDAYALTARGIIAFHEARENRDPSREGSKMRQQLFVRSAQYFERALQQHKHCAIAAQGIAILIAENVLGSGIETSTMAGEVNTAMVAMNKNTRDALTILNKVKESVNDASVYVNIGHCHFHREEFERAIESVSPAPVSGCFPVLGQALNCERGTSQYETASKRYHKDQDATILQYLARAWYHKGVKDQSFNDIRQALEKGRLALSLQPRDLSIKYNIALMQQKGVQVLFDLTPQRRTLEQLRLAIQDANESQALFLELQNDPTDPAPYQKDFPRQRFNYGKGLLTRAPLIQEAQETYEATEQAAVDRARQAREEERRRRDEMEAQRLAQLQEQASRLAEQRKRMQEEAAQWTLSATFADSDEDGFEAEGKEKKKREKKSVGGGKKRGKKEKREGSETAESSSEGEEDKPKKKRVKGKSKKDRQKSETPGAEMDLDEDGEEAVTGGNRRKRIGRASKNIKSNEFIESSDEDE